jgi:hypothetical protein
MSVMDWRVICIEKKKEAKSFFELKFPFNQLKKEKSL